MDLRRFQNKGKFLMLALDHRGSLKKMLLAAGMAVEKEDIIKWKMAALKALSSLASAALVDPEFGLPALKRAKIKKPFFLSIEKTGYEDESGERKTVLEYSVPQLKKMGAAGVKLLIFYNPEATVEYKEKQIKTTKKVFSDCKKSKLPFLLEIVTYGSGEGAKKEKGVFQSVKDFLAAGVQADIFKIEFPGKSFGLKISEELEKTPWILLSAGGDFPVFRKQVKTAMANGAKGFLAGRAIWKDFGNYKEGELEKFFKEKAVGRFSEICKIALG